jgi:predicted nucleic acid-binding protein
VVIVDTTVWVDYLRGTPTPQAEWLDRELSRQRLGLTDLILCEILQGISSDQQAARVLRDLRQFEIFDTGGIGLAVAAARNYRHLRARGLTVRKTIDCLIATFCIVGDHALLHSDREFDPFENTLGLRVIHPQVHRTR